MKKIPLSQGEYAIVDNEDFETLNKHKWTVSWGKTSPEHRAVRAEMAGGKYIRVTMSRQIMGIVSGDKEFVDHINHNTLDNRRRNLRICTHSQNCMNKAGTNRTSQFKGVSSSRLRENPWRARIKLNQKETHLGHFASEIEAARAYDEAAKRVFGEFAYLNNI